MLPDRVSNPGSLTYKSGALASALRGPAKNGGGVFNLLANVPSMHYLVQLNKAIFVVEIFQPISSILRAM